MDVIQRINALYPKMTKKQKSIADCLLESPEDIAYITLAQLSKKTASSELTLLRFCQKLGYANFLEMKNAFREYTQNMVKLLSSPQYFVPDATITDENGEVHTACEIGSGPIDAMYSAINNIVQAENDLMEYSVNAVTRGIDALGEVTVRIMDRDGAIFIGRGSDRDITVSSGKAYVNALNRMIDQHRHNLQRTESGSDAPAHI